MTSINILFLIVVSLVAYSLIATYLFWLMRHDLRYLDRKLSGARSDISTLATAYETLRSLLEHTGKNQAEVLSIIAEENNRIERLEGKLKYNEVTREQIEAQLRDLVWVDFEEGNYRAQTGLPLDAYHRRRKERA